MKGVKVLKDNPQNLTGRKLSNFNMNEACSNMTRRIMGNTKLTRWLERFAVAKAERQAARLRRLREKKVAAGRGWFRALTRKIFRRNK